MGVEGLVGANAKMTEDQRRPPKTSPEVHNVHQSSYTHRTNEQRHPGTNGQQSMPPPPPPVPFPFASNDKGEACLQQPLHSQGLPGTSIGHPNAPMHQPAPAAKPHDGTSCPAC